MRIIAQRAGVQGTRLSIAAVVGVLMCMNLCACAARHILSNKRLAEAETNGAADVLRVYVSHRTVAVYDRGVLDTTVVRKQVDRRKVKDRLKVKLGRNDSGIVVDEGALNGHRLLWVSFSRRCQSQECAFGFVHTEDGRYRLVELPERDEFADPYAFRSCTIKRQKLRLERLYAISDANAVFKLKRKRKRRPKTVFLEYKLRDRERIRRKQEDLEGQD
jgi:hypothetical protein